MNIEEKFVKFCGIKDDPSLIKETIGDTKFRVETMKKILRRIEKNVINKRVNAMIVTAPDIHLIDFLEEE